MIILVTFFALLIIGTSYALWQMTFRQSNTNAINTDCFKVEFNDKNPITLGDAYPITDEESKNLVPYEFTITNICSEYARYEVNLEVLSETTLGNLSYIKTMVDDGTPEILTGYEKVDPTLSNAVDSYNLEVGYLEKNKSKTFNLRLWLDEDTPLSEDTMNQSFLSKVTVTTSDAKKLPGTLRNVGFDSTVGMWEYKSNITKLVIQNKLSKIDNAIKVSDESLEQDGSIMSYVVPNEDGETYTAYLQGQDVIYLNSDSSYLFYNFNKLEQLDGIKFFNTSAVTNMKNMFYNCYNLKNLDLSKFDTSKVTDMSSMFYRCSGLMNLDLSNFNTNKVTNMSSMFRDDSSLTSLDLSSFDTSSVTGMNDMFYNCGNLTRLDLSNFNTNKVKVMSDMFALCSKLTYLDVSNFDTRMVTRMNYMFSGCSSLSNLELSNFDTGNVTSMQSMFTGCSSLTSLKLKNFNTSQVTIMDSMFRYCNSLETLDLSSFNTNKVTNMQRMFDECSSLTSLDLSSFNTDQVTSMYSMFYNCSNLTSITYGANFFHKSGATTSNMFYECPANKPTHSSWNGVTF